MSRPATSVRALPSKDVPIEPSHAAPEPSSGPSPGPRSHSAPAAPSVGPKGANGARALNGAGEAVLDFEMRPFHGGVRHSFSTHAAELLPIHGR